MRVRDRLGITRRRQRQASRLLQLCLVGFFFVGLDRHSLGIVVNSALGLGVTYLPALLQRDYDIPMDPALVLWITAAVFLHALGTLGPYHDVWWWDHVTHTLSASLVAAVGYAAARAVDEHVEELYLPPTFMFAFILLVTVAFGVLWEVIEFAVGGLSTAVGSGAILTQFGLTDTMFDLLFDVLGGVVVAVWGTAYLTDVVAALQRRLDQRSA